MIVLLILTIAISTAIINSEVEAADQHVADNGDISAALSAVNNGESIYLAANSIYNNKNINYNLTINKNVSIIGKNNNVTIQSDGSSRIFNIISNVSVTFINITFKGGHEYDGGAIYFNGTNLSVINCKFQNNSGSNLGGAIFNVGSNFSVFNSSFMNNTAIVGGVICNSGDGFTVFNSCFVNNIASAGGGAIYNSVGDGFSLFNSCFVNNIANVGGAIYNSAGDGFSLFNSSFMNNTVSNIGGAIYNGGDGFSVFNSCFVNNIASAGGAIYNLRDDGCNMFNSIFLNNTASDYGGAIFKATGNLYVNNSIFISNNAAVFGGAIFNDYDGALSISNSNFTNNSHVVGTTNTFFNISNNNIMINNIVGIQFVLFDQVYYINDILGTSIMENNTYAICFDGRSSNYTLNSRILSNNVNGVLFANNSNNNILKDFVLSGFNVAVTFDINSKNNILLNATIFNNYLGILMRGTNNSLVNSTVNNNIIAINVSSSINSTINGSNVLNNNRGIIVDGSSNGNTVNYNRIVNNTFFNNLNLENNGNNTNANFNWWSINDISSLYVNSGSGFNLTYWYVLTLASNTTTTVNTTRSSPYGNNVNLSFTLALNGNIANDPNLLPYFLVNLLFYNGNVLMDNISGDARTTVFSVNLALLTTLKIESLSDNDDLYLLITLEKVNISIIKTVNISGIVLKGDLITYTITVTNNGPADATGVLVSDNLDNRLIYINSTSTRGSYNNLTGIWTIGNLANNETVFLNITVRVNGAGNINNFVNVTVNENNTGNNNTNVNITAKSSVNITILKTINVTGTILNGELVTYTITVTNYGPDNATGLIVTDVLDSRLIYINSNATVGNYNYSTSNWIIGNLNNGETVVLNIIVKLNGTANIVNSANVTLDQINIGNNGTEGNHTNITVLPSVNISITKTVNVSGDVSNGTLIRYTIIVVNYGPDNATGVNVTDILNKHLIYLKSITTQGTYNYKTGKWTIGNIAVGKTVKLDIFVRVNGTGNIANFATLTVDQINTYDINGSDSYSVNFTSKYPTKLILTTKKYNQHLQFKATLTSNGKKLSGKTVKFYINGKCIGQSKTNSKGIATLKYKVKIYGKLKIFAIFNTDKNYLSSNKTIYTHRKLDHEIVYRDSIVRKGRYYLATYILINVGSSSWSHYFKEFTKKYHKVFKVKVTKFKISYNQKTLLLKWNIKGLNPRNIAKMYIIYDYKY
jgi:uncharacterized repeat protein (TIGR01451 family)